MNKGPSAFLLAIFKGKNLSVSEENAVAILERGEVDALAARYGKSFVPRFNFCLSVFVVVRSLLHEGRRLVPGLAVLLLHGRYEIFGGFDLGCVGCRDNQKYQT